MPQRNGRVDALLDANETVVERIDLGASEAVVTSDRVLGVDASDDRSYRAVDRASVDDVSVGADGDAAYLRKAATFGFVSAVFLALDVTVDFRALLPVGAADVPAQAAQLLDLIVLVFTAIDLTLTILWATAALAALAYLWKYVRGRKTVLELSVADGDDVVLPSREDPPVERLESALASGSPGGTGSAGPADASTTTADASAPTAAGGTELSDSSGDPFADGSVEEATDRQIEELLGSESSDDVPERS